MTEHNAQLPNITYTFLLAHSAENQMHTTHLGTTTARSGKRRFIAAMQFIRSV